MFWSSASLFFWFPASLRIFLATSTPPKLWLTYIAVALAIPFLFEATKTSNIDDWIGGPSYPLYIVHFLVIRLVPALGVHSSKHIVAIMVLGSLVAAWLLMKYVERPVDLLRHKISAKNPS